MPYDQTRIVIRRRGIWEILDLSLRFARIYAKPLCASVLWIGLPFYLANLLLLRAILADEYTTDSVTQYVALSALLVFLQAPIVTLPTTVALGRAMFLQDLGWRSILSDMQQTWPGMLWTQGVLRGGWLLVLLMIALPRSIEDGTGQGLLIGLAFYSLLMRVVRPFINEIVVLERQPIRARERDRLTIRIRSQILHHANTGVQFGRWIVTAAATVMLTTSVILTMWFALGMVTNDWRWSPLFLQLVLPCALWLSAIYATIVKFINYLDLRIRREGWEVELSVRAAAQELELASDTGGYAA